MRHKNKLGLVLGVACVWSLSSCDRDPLATRPSPESVPDSQSPSSTAIPLGSFSIPIPSNNATDDGRLGWTSTGITTSVAGAYHVKVSGMVQVSTSVDWMSRPCSTGNPAPEDGRSAGPMGLLQSDGTRRLVVNVGYKTAGATYVTGFPIYGEIGGSEASDTLTLPAGATLYALRSGLSGGGQCVLGSGQTSWHYMYDFGGSQLLTVEQIPATLSVSADRTEVLVGDTVTFTAVGSTYPSNVRWYFQAGDTGAAPAAFGGSYVGGCNTLRTCKYAPTASGRMHVQATVGAVTKRAASPVIRVEKSRLTVQCSPEPVTRGQRVDCTARAEPAGVSMEVLEWNFRDAQGNTIPGPAGETAWGGTMAVGGTVTVRARLDGAEKSASATVTVAPRDWSGRIRYPAEPAAERRGAPEFRYPPVDSSKPTPDAHGAFGLFDGSAPTAGVGVGTGPNDGWFFLDDVVFTQAPRILLNRAIYPDDPFYQAQQGGSGMCDQAFMQTLQSSTSRHEKDHYAIDRSHYESAGTAAHLEAQVVFDPSTGLSPADLDQRFFGTVEQQRSQQQSQHDATDVFYITCQFHFI